MSIETLDDILEELADREEIHVAFGWPGWRIEWMSDMKKRILYAVEVEKKLNEGAVISTGFQERVISTGVQSASGVHE